MVELETVDEAVLQRFVQRVLEHARREPILLFGSRAWSTPRDDSSWVERWNGGTAE